jgi:hypothetical protein
MGVLKVFGKFFGRFTLYGALVAAALHTGPAIAKMIAGEKMEAKEYPWATKMMAAALGLESWNEDAKQEAGLTPKGQALAAAGKEWYDKQKDLNKDLADMQDAFHIAMAEINKDIAAVIAQINTLLVLMATLGGLGSTKSGGGSTKTSTKYDPLSSFNVGSFRLAEAKSNSLTLNLTTNTNASAQDIQNTVVNGYKYGSTVIVGQRVNDR